MGTTLFGPYVIYIAKDLFLVPSVVLKCHFDLYIFLCPTNVNGWRIYKVFVPIEVFYKARKASFKVKFTLFATPLILDRDLYIWI